MFLIDVFESVDLKYVTMSRWSKNQGMVVLKKRSMVFDLDSVCSNNELIDYSKGLSAEEKKDLAVQDKIKYGQIKAGDIAAKRNTSGALVQTVHTLVYTAPTHHHI